MKSYVLKMFSAHNKIPCENSCPSSVAARLAFLEKDGLHGCFRRLTTKKKTFRRAFSSSSSLKSVFEKLLFGDGLVWTVGLTACRNKAMFANFTGLGWTGPKNSSSCPSPLQLSNPSV